MLQTSTTNKITTDWSWNDRKHNADYKTTRETSHNPKVHNYRKQHLHMRKAWLNLNSSTTCICHQSKRMQSDNKKRMTDHRCNRLHHRRVDSILQDHLQTTWINQRMKNRYTS